MLNLREIFKPDSIQEALSLLAEPNVVPLAGGTALISARRPEVRAVVDLGNLGLDYIRDQQGDVAIGAMTLLADVSDSPILRAVVDGIVARAAHDSTSSLMRNQATLVGTLLAEPAGILASTLVAMEASVTIVSNLPESPQSVRLMDLLDRPGELLVGKIVTQVLIPVGVLHRRGAIASVARTPRDKPIVAVCATAEFDNGIARSASVALSGLAETVVRADGTERVLIGQPVDEGLITRAASKSMSGVRPQSDVRGSAEYRGEMAQVLTARALREIWELV